MYNNNSSDLLEESFYSPDSTNFLTLDTPDTSSRSSTPTFSRPVSPFTCSTFDVSLKDKIHSRINSGDRFFSLEFFPPRTKSGAVNLLTRLDRMRTGGPLFSDITWHPAGNPAGDTETSSMMIAQAAVNYCGIETMLHMTCLGYTRDQVSSYLHRAKNYGIRNILALRGDQSGGKIGDFRYGVDLVRHIKEEFDDYFVIGVAGYPTGHPDAESYEKDLQHLKDKVDAGADFIITQLFFGHETFIDFVNDCRSIGIECPILPGIMPIQSYDSLHHIVKLSKLHVPEPIKKKILSLKGNDIAIRKYGVHLAVGMIRELFSRNYVAGIHLYTLNREVATTAILKQVGLWECSLQKPLPWKLAANHKRSQEEVRPIFWTNRSKSYIYRTRHWDEFPNGRWGTSESPAFGDLKDYYLFYLQRKSPQNEMKMMWGYPQREEDVFDVFYCYLTGQPNPKTGERVLKIPFNDDELSPETGLISDKLAVLNKKGILTVNSQPSVNCASSEDKVVGWGMPGGYVFQKAYLEFFTCEENVISLLQVLERYPKVNFQITNKDGRREVTNCHKRKPIAVTWGVFPGGEIVQPTVVDPVSFQVWKDEAFNLWRLEWAKLYEVGSTSYKVIDNIYNNYYLVNLVDNDFPNGNCLWNLLTDMFMQKESNRLRNDCDYMDCDKVLADNATNEHIEMLFSHYRKSAKNHAKGRHLSVSRLSLNEK